jgi:hypothetical protein
VGTVVAIVRARAGDHLPTRNAQGNPAVYALYRSEGSGESTPLLQRHLYPAAGTHGAGKYVDLEQRWANAGLSL